MLRASFRVIILAGALTCFFETHVAAANIEVIKPVKTHITIIVDDPVLRTGGTVLVVPKKVSPDVWRKLRNRPEKSMLQDNPKAREIRHEDKLLEVRVSSKVSVVEFDYPADGTYGFNLVSGDNARQSALRTKRVLVGSGYYTDQKTGARVDWDEVSTIHIFGPDVDESFSRSVRISSNEIMNSGADKIAGEGFVVHRLSDEQIDRAVIKEPK
ncbi:hypothetical protein [Agrobacterium cavarae]|uniref:hypothetical protein n=1 Tax=Agrobacterium cavarae TaxID=2528239 RepID=UPI0028A1201C|nr:hypothetical protein [Agrobacterium cavarae]